MEHRQSEQGKPRVLGTMWRTCVLTPLLRELAPTGHFFLERGVKTCANEYISPNHTFPAVMIAAWIPPPANAVKDFEGHDSVTLVYYLGTCLAAEGAARCPAELRRPPAAAACPVRPPIGDWVVLSHPSTTPEAANTVP